MTVNVECGRNKEGCSRDFLSNCAQSPPCTIENQTLELPDQSRSHAYAMASREDCTCNDEGHLITWIMLHMK